MDFLELKCMSLYLAQIIFVLLIWPIFSHSTRVLVDTESVTFHFSYTYISLWAFTKMTSITDVTYTILPLSKQSGPKSHSALPPKNCVTLRKLFKLLVLQFTHLLSGDKIINYMEL